jgi:hypothetical protein
MKMVKSLFLGSAAGLVAIAGAQAADLPVKAKPVEYVKICTLYGDGFYYIPGTDTCLKVGGYVRADYAYNAETNTVEYSGVNGAQDRSGTRNAYTTRHRLNIQLDARTQTGYGTLRAFESLHVENRGQGGATNVVVPVVQRAFIQWVGFTFGHTSSFTDNAGSLGDGGMRSLFQSHVESTQSANGINQIAYTWELGNGITLNVGADEQRANSLSNLSVNTAVVGTTIASNRTGEEHPSPWVALRVNQAWGKASVAFIAQENRATYYTTAVPAIGPACPVGAQSGTTQCFYPDDTWGWAVKAGAEFNMNMISPGDRFAIFGNYSEGYSQMAASNLATPGLFGAGGAAGTLGTIALGWVTDGVFLNGGQIEQTTVWTAGGAYEHFWSPQFSSSVYGGIAVVDYNAAVVNSGTFCKAAGVTPLSGQLCDPSFRLWQVGTHQDWFPVPGFRLAVDVMYTRIETAMAGLVRLGPVVPAGPVIGSRPAGVYSAQDDGILAVMFRAQRGFPAGGE